MYTSPCENCPDRTYPTKENPHSCKTSCDKYNDYITKRTAQRKRVQKAAALSDAAHEISTRNVPKHLRKQRYYK